MSMTHAQRAYAERIGAYWESVGFAHAAGLIIGFLMVCDPARQSQAAIGRELHLSAGSVSTHVRALHAVGLLDRARVPGERTAYYEIPPGAWTRLMEAEGERIAAIAALADAGSRVLPATRPERITEMGDMARFFQREWPAVMARMNEELGTRTE
jgi:DNA-binding transcriptional regulator GbsR (MarR family)